MRRSRLWTDEQVEAARQMYRDGRTTNEISAFLRVGNNGSVQDMLFGRTYKHARNPILDSERKAVNPVPRLLAVDKRPVSSTQRVLLDELLRLPGRIVSYDHLMRVACISSDDVLKVHISRARQRTPHVEITSVFKVGYRATMRRAG